MVDMKLKKREAADFLNRKGRRIELIFFGLLLVFATILPFYLYLILEPLSIKICDAIVGFYNLTLVQAYIALLLSFLLSAILSAAVAVFFTLPVYSCFFDFSYKIYRDGACGRQRYLGFGKRGYWGAFRAGLVFALVFALSIAPVIAIVVLGKYFANFEDIRVASLVSELFLIMLAIGFVLGFLIFMLFKPFFLFGYYIAKGKRVIESLVLSVRQMKNERAKEIYFAYVKSFIPSLLLSLATLLIFFFIDTLPKMMMVYFDVAEEIAYGE